MAMRQTTTTTSTLSSSSSSLLASIGELEYTFSKNGTHVDIKVASTATATAKTVDESKAVSVSDTTTEAVPTAGTTDSTIPLSVLQYERQKRKVQAEDRASNTNLSKEKHLHILYQDSDIIVVNKPPGILCVPGIHNKPSLLDLVQDHCMALLDTHTTTKANTTTTLEERSKWIVHRLDMDTSGIVVFAKTERALKTLQAAFRDRHVEKEYHALLCGHMNCSPSSDNDSRITESIEVQSGSIQLPLQRDHKHPPFMRVATPSSEDEAQQVVELLQQHGYKKLIKKRPKPSHTEFIVLNQYEYITRNSCGTIRVEPLFQQTSSSPSQESCTQKNQVSDSSHPSSRPLPVTRVRLIPHTGRTHQLRVHCSAIGHPIVGDPAYGIYGEANRRGGLLEPKFNPLGKSRMTMGVSVQDELELTKIRPVHDNPMCLHAAKLVLHHPINDQIMTFEAPTPF